MILGRSGEAVELLTSMPDVVVILFAFVTQLGDLWFFFVLLTAAYWFGDRTGFVTRRGATFLIAMALASIVAVEGLKHLFALPRPPTATTTPEAQSLPAAIRPVYRELAVSDGFGFPSGHATAVTAMYGAATLVVDYRSRAWRAGVAGAVVVLVSLSRVVLGVHYLADVVAGIVLGATLLALVAYVGQRGDAPGRALTLIVFLALLPPLVAFNANTIAALGGAIGARLTWGIVGGELLAQPLTRQEAIGSALIGFPTAGGLFISVYALDVPIPVVFLANALVLATVFAAPVLARWVLPSVSRRATKQ